MQSTCVVQLGADLAYYVKHPPLLHLTNVHNSPNSIEPSVLISLPAFCSDIESFLREKLRSFEAIDDVYQPVFAETGCFIFQYAGKLEYGLRTVEEGLCTVFTNKKVIFRCSSAGNMLPEGPYFIANNKALHQAWRLYPDELGAFVLATVPVSTLGQKGEYKFQPVLATSLQGDELAIAVPSRLYTPPSPKLPLNGKRISIKDNIHLAGTRTSLGNRAYLEYYPPQEETADFVKLLIDKGAVIVGKTKMNAFAGSEKPPNQVIDYFPSWNPRADGYQRPSGSSTGAGVSVAAYDWCDYAIGTDTTGSGREPARAVGVQGLRLTHRLVSVKGVVPSSEEFDSIAFLTRGLEELYHLTATSTEGRLLDALPTKIIYPTDWLPYKIPEQQKMNEEFLAAMEDLLQVKHTKICLADMWKQSPPAEAQGKSIAEFLENSGFWPMYYDNYHAFDDFRAGYEKKFEKKVYVSPPQRWKWELGAKVTPEQRAQGLAECKVYKKWIKEHVLTLNGQGEGEAVILLPLGNAEPEYRDVESGPPSVVKSFEPKYFASVLGLPQIVVPIGQLPYESRISQRKEYIPVIATIAGAQGSDMMLIKVTRLTLERVGWPTEVQTGRNSFPFANNSRNVATVLTSKLA